VLDIAVAQVDLECSRIVPFIGQRESTGVPKHMRMRRKFEPGCLTSTHSCMTFDKFFHRTQNILSLIGRLPCFCGSGALPPRKVFQPMRRLGRN
jgi:hypothetical protein